MNQFRLDKQKPIIAECNFEKDKPLPHLLIIIKAIVKVVKRNDENLIEKINSGNIVEFLTNNIR